VPHFERVEAARQDVQLTYFEFTTLAILSLLAASELDVAILEVGPGRAAGRGEHHRHRLRHHHQHRPGPPGVPGPGPRSIGREKAGILRAGKPAIVSDPVPPRSVLQYAARRRRPVAAGTRLQLLRRQAAVGLGRPRPALRRAWPIRRCAAPTS
jgi:dihydrofolate synthase/folylpolyglutamate synthase